MLASSLAVVSLVSPEASFAMWLPDFGQGARGLLASSPATFVLVAAPLVAAAWATARDRVDPTRAALLGIAFVAFPCALFDRRFFAPLSVAWIGLVASACSGSWIRAAANRARVVGTLFALTAVGSFVAWATGVRGAEDPAHDALVTALRWLREHSSSPGSFNHPQAPQSWRVVAAPELAGAIAFHARRPVWSASFDGTETARAASTATLLGADDIGDLARDLANTDCEYLVLTPRMLRDERFRRAAGEAPGALEQLLFPEPGPSEVRVGEFELVYASARWESPAGVEPRDGDEAGPAVSIWRRTLASRREPRASSTGDGGGRK
jgi:hypothetical protein